MDALSHLFLQVDKIKQDHPNQEPPPWIGVEVEPKTLDAPIAHPKPSQQEQADRKELNRLGFKNQRNWKDVRAQKEEDASKRIEDRLAHPNGGTFAQDEEGLNKAYADTSGEGYYYNPENRTLYIKGTVPTSLKDWSDDVRYIPFWGDIHNADRSKQAFAAYDRLINEGKYIDRVVGHSLGGSVSLQLQQDKGIELSRTYGAPVWDIGGVFHRGAVERYRHPLDPVSIFDRGATITWRQPQWNSHGYDSYDYLDKKSHA
jgi:hypothetical protein